MLSSGDHEPEGYVTGIFSDLVILSVFPAKPELQEPLTDPLNVVILSNPTSPETDSQLKLQTPELPKPTPVSNIQIGVSGFSVAVFLPNYNEIRLYTP